jgi:LysR family glycine cleavage system transcriptional activator
MSASRLPPLNALRAFEAVARHRSFRKAAEELFVTPGAISHQIKLLEQQLGLALFERRNRGIELTHAAQDAFPRFQQSFEILGQAVSELRRYGRTPYLTIGGTPTFVSRWLMPRLQGYLQQHADLDVRVIASGELFVGRSPADRNRHPVSDAPDTDVDIRFTGHRPAGRFVDLLFAVEVVPMCHPRLITGPPPLAAPSDLRHQTLLHGDGRNADRSRSIWARWLRLAGLTDIDPRHGVQFDHSRLALEAAADGLGVVLATPRLAAAELADHKVAVAFPIAMPLDMAYYAVASDTAMERAEVTAFRSWLIQEASR